MPRKRASNGHGHIRQRADGRWEAQILLPPDPGTGKQKRKSIYGKTEGEVAKKLRQISVDVDNGVYTEPRKMKLSQWLQIWLDEYTGHLKPGTKSLYKRHALKIIAPKLGAVLLPALSKAAVQKFINDLQRGDKPLAPKSIKNVHGVLHKALEQAVELEYTPVNNATSCKLPRVERVDIKPLGNDDINRFMERVKGHRFERAYLVALFTGTREGELLGLKWDAIDFERGTITINRQLQLIDGTYQIVAPKNDKSRKITPAKFVMDTLRAHRREQVGWRLQAGVAWQDEGFVFTNEIGQHLARQTIYKSFKAIMKDMGLPTARFHDLRHTYAVASLQSGDDVKTVQENLGHHTAAFTLDIYGHVTEQMKRDSAARMDVFINGIQTGQKS